MTRTHTIAALVIGLAVSLMAPAMASAKGHAHGHGVLNKPRCEALKLAGAYGEWSNDEGIKTCAFTFEFRLLDLTYEMEQKIAEFGSLPGIKTTITQHGTLRITLDVSVVLGASQLGNVGAPGTSDTFEAFVHLMLDLNIWWEDCRTHVLTQGQLPPFGPFTFPIVTLIDEEVPSPDAACTAALVGSLL